MPTNEHGVTDELPLAGFLVLDLVRGPLSGITRVYADLGACVVRMVDEPSLGEIANRSDRLAAALSSGGKLRLAPQAAEFERLVARADLIVEDGHAHGAAAPDWRSICQARPDLVVLSVSMFGAGNHFSGWQATDPVLHALSGQLSRSGIRGREPLLPPGEIGLQSAVMQAAFAGLTGLYSARMLGRGDHLDFSALDGSVQALDPGFGIGGSATLGRPANQLSRRRPLKGFQYPILPCADGSVRLCLLAARQWQGMFQWMGAPAQFADPSFNKTIVRYNSPELLPAISAFFADKSRLELEAGAARFGVPLTGMFGLDECLQQPHLSQRGVVREIDVPGLGPVPALNGLMEIDGVRAVAPVSGNPLPNTGAAHQPVSRVGSDRLRPLAGVKVLDLGVIVVGAEQGRLLADLGADVIKVEASSFPDGTRQTYLPTGLSVGFAAGHRNKRSLGLNLRSEDGKAIFRELVAQADIVLANYKPGTLESLGLGYADLKTINPGLVMVQSSAFGSHGPWSKRMGYGPLVRAVAGLTSMWRYPDDPQGFADSITIYPDHVAARVGAIAVLALLLRRARTGMGGLADIAQLEVMLGHFETAFGGEINGPKDAPWGVFRARDDDDWCVVTVRDTADWRALVQVLERPDLALDATLDTRAGRLARAEDINAAVAAWLSTLDADAAMRTLQAIGVPAAKMLRVADQLDFAYFRDRGLFRSETHPHLEEDVTAEAWPVVSQVLQSPEMRPAPLLGENSIEVVRDWLGLDDVAISQLVENGAIELVDPVIAGMLARGEGRGEVRNA